MRAALIVAVTVAFGNHVGMAAADAPTRNMYVIAMAAWPTSFCLGAEKVYVVDALPDGNRGESRASTCEVWIVHDLSALEECTVLVHEFGHLAGYSHTEEESPPPDSAHRGVMSIPLQPWPPCSDGLRAVSPQEALQRVTALRPRRHRAWCRTWRTDIDYTCSVLLSASDGPVRYRVMATSGAPSVARLN